MSLDEIHLTLQNIVVQSNSKFFVLAIRLSALAITMLLIVLPNGYAT